MPMTPDEKERLEPLMRQAEKHWKEHLPKKWAALQKQGEEAVNAALLEAARLTAADLDDFEDGGIPDNLAWEAVRGRYLLLDPDEEGYAYGEKENREMKRDDPEYYQRLEDMETLAQAQVADAEDEEE